MTTKLSRSSPHVARLLALLEETTHSASDDLTPILICAPAGYGKTRLVTTWLAAHPDERIVRMRCLPDSAPDLWTDIVHVVTQFLGSPLPPRSRSHTALLRLLAELDEPLTLVIDDYHFATSPQNDVALLDLIGQHLRLVVIARRVCLLDGPLAARRVPMLCLSMSDLALPPHDALEHARTNLGAPERPETEAALDLACGWPLAVRAAFVPTARQAGSVTAPGECPSFQLDPLSALVRFGQNQLEGLGSAAQLLLLSASEIDVIDVDQATHFVGDREARQALNQLIELGLIVPAASGDTEEFTCHPAVRRGVAARADQRLSTDQRNELLRSRAAKISGSAPLSGFRMFLSAQEFDAAELVLAQHFTTITDEIRAGSHALQAIPADVLERHPTFIAARLFFDFSAPETSTAAFPPLIAMWHRSLKRRAKHPEHNGELEVPYLMQAMVATRLRGDASRASELSLELEARVESSIVFTQPALATGFGARRALGSGSLPAYYYELANTAVASGQFDRARRLWERLRSHTENLIAYPWNGFAPSSTRTVTDVESGQRWLLASLYELSLTEILDGNVYRAMELLEEASELVHATDALAPSDSAVSASVARAHLAYEIGDPGLYEAARETISTFAERSSQWPWLLIAESALILTTRGPEWALTHFEAGMRSITTGRHRAGYWNDLLQANHAQLTTVLGRYAETERLLNAMPQVSAATHIERARLALFAANNIDALFHAQQASETVSSQRQLTHCLLIIACASWHAGREREAFEALSSATERIERFGHVSALRGVPYASLVAIAEAACDTGVADATQLIAAVPEPARAQRYEALTEMELRTLRAIAAHRRTNEAAEALFVTPATVKKHLNAVYRKLGAKGRDNALLRAGYMGLLTE